MTEVLMHLVVDWESLHDSVSLADGTIDDQMGRAEVERLEKLIERGRQLLRQDVTG